jgi:hypothetical protein
MLQVFYMDVAYVADQLPCSTDCTLATRLPPPAAANQRGSQRLKKTDRVYLLSAVGRLVRTLRLAQNDACTAYIVVTARAGVGLQHDYREFFFPKTTYIMKNKHGVVAVCVFYYFSHFIWKSAKVQRLKIK